VKTFLSAVVIASVLGAVVVAAPSPALADGGSTDTVSFNGNGWIAERLVSAVTQHVTITATRARGSNPSFLEWGSYTGAPGTFGGPDGYAGGQTSRLSTSSVHLTSPVGLDVNPTLDASVPVVNQSPFTMTGGVYLRAGQELTLVLLTTDVEPGPVDVTFTATQPYQVLARNVGTSAFAYDASGFKGETNVYVNSFVQAAYAVGGHVDQPASGSMFAWYYGEDADSTTNYDGPEGNVHCTCVISGGAPGAYRFNYSTKPHATTTESGLLWPYVNQPGVGAWLTGADVVLPQ
jgi:hypothetical protein